MEKELEREAYTLKDDGNDGVVSIADDVVAMIASIAATEVEGVASMVGNITNELMSRVGMKKLLIAMVAVAVVSKGVQKISMNNTSTT